MLYLLSVILAVLPLQETDFSIPSTEWNTNIVYDDFTDEVDNISAIIFSEDEKSGVKIACGPNTNNFVFASFVFFGEYLGSGESTAVRWRVGEQAAQADRWWISDNSSTKFFRGKRDDPRAYPFIAGILASTDDPDETMIFEATDYDNDRHRGKVVLKGAKEAVEEVLQACEK